MLAEQAQSLQVPDEAFAANEMRPGHLLMEIQSRATRTNPGVQPAFDPGTGRAAYPVQQGVYDPRNDASQNVAANAESMSPVPPGANAPAGGAMTQGSRGQMLYQQGLEVLARHDRDTAMDRFSEAWQYEAELDPATRQALRDKLTLLRTATPRTPSLPPTTAWKKWIRSNACCVTNCSGRSLASRAASEKIRNADPRGSLERLQRLREQVEQEALDPPTRRQLLTLVDRSIREPSVTSNRTWPTSNCDERNDRSARTSTAASQDKLDRQNKLAELVEQFNDLIDEQRFAEAEVLAKQARELDPESEVVRSMLLTSKFAWRVQEQRCDQGHEGAGILLRHDLPSTVLDPLRRS